MPEHLAPLLADLRRRLEALYGPRLVRLVHFGSQARGDAEPGSDIDVLVVLEGLADPIAEIHRTSHIMAGLSLHYDEVNACVFVDREQYERKRSPLMLNVHREGVAV